MQLRKAAEESREQYRELSKARAALKEEAVDKGNHTLPGTHFYHAALNV